jgi:uroporphyrin-III C-methyltransferase/precorrin-2 dehydrogenase/sirohydrochlorin ferrochelatase
VATPAAIVQQGTTDSQQVLTGTLQTLPALAAAAQLAPPALLIVGSVVSLRDKLSWYDTEGERFDRAAAEQRG